MLIKVAATRATRAELMQIVKTFRAKIVGVSAGSVTVEATGNESKIDAMLELLRPFGIREVVRTGTVAISRKSELSTNGQAASGAPSARGASGNAKTKKVKKQTVRKAK